MIKDIKTIYLDWDGVITNTVAAVVSLYNEDFQFYKKFEPINWWKINTWDFKECNCATSEYINTYFNQKRLFDRLEFMPDAKKSIEKIKELYKIKIVTHGYSPNLKLKELWLEDNLPEIEMIGVNMKKHNDKSSVDMSDGVFIDDNSKNLLTSNAKVNVCYGEIYSWNEGWDGRRLQCWNDIVNYLL